MNETSIRQYIVETFAGVEVVEASGGSFFFDGSDHKFPFATLSTSDEYDQASNLNRPGIFRLNVGVSKETFKSLFAAGPAPGDAGHAEASWDFTALDRLMPHPVYGKLYWVCVLNPSTATFNKIKELLAEAYDMAVRKRTRSGQADEA